MRAKANLCDLERAMAAQIHLPRIMLTKGTDGQTDRQTVERASRRAGGRAAGLVGRPADLRLAACVAGLSAGWLAGSQTGKRHSTHCRPPVRKNSGSVFF